MRTGFIAGAFDMYNTMHLNALKSAKESCDYLIVGVCSDSLVIKECLCTPIIPFEERCTILRSVRYVDRVVTLNTNSLKNTIELYKFNRLFVCSNDFFSSYGDIDMFDSNTDYFDIVEIPQISDFSSAFLKEHNMILPNDCIVGYTQGVYDLFHIGHLNLIREAKSRCDVLLVGVNSDDLVKNYKHKTPVICEKDRAAIIKSIIDVDHVIICDTLDKIRTCIKYHVNKVFIGDDWKGNERWLQTEKELAPYGCEVVYLPHTSGISSSMIRTKVNK